MTRVFAISIFIMHSVLFTTAAYCDDPLLEALKISESGAKLQTVRMKVIAENIANAESVATKKKSVYCRRVVVVKASGGKSKTVKYKIRKSFATSFVKKYDPSHPHADGSGYIYMSNVNRDIERADVAEAQVSYEANLKMIKALGNMTTSTIELLK